MNNTQYGKCSFCGEFYEVVGSRNDSGWHRDSTGKECDGAWKPVVKDSIGPKEDNQTKGK